MGQRLLVAIVAAALLLAIGGMQASAAAPPSPGAGTSHTQSRYPGVLAERHLSSGSSGGAAQARPSIPAVACSASWRRVAVPDGSWNNLLGGVAADSPTDIFAVGDDQDQNTGNDVNLAERWDGKSWSIFSNFPNPGGGGNDLTDVAVASPTNAWASGVSFGTDGSFVPYAYHWDGTTWSAFTPPPNAANGIMNQVAIGPGGAAWFAGFLGREATVWELPSSGIWSQTSFGVTDPGGSMDFNSLSVTSTGDVWLVGSVRANSASPRQPFIKHWNGSTWSEYDPGPTGVDSSLLHISMVSNTEGLAVGWANSNGHRTPMAMHWNGTAWLSTSPPVLGTGDSELEGLIETSATDAWAVGFWRAAPTSAFQSLVAHWDGSTWTASSGANLFTGDNQGISVAEPAGGDVWSVGTVIGVQGLGRNLAEQLTDLGVPTGVTAQGQDSSANVSWTGPCPDAGNPVTSYIVKAYDGCTLEGSSTVAGTMTATTFTGLNNGSAVNFTVTAVNAWGAGPESVHSSFVIPNGTTASTWSSACSAQQYTQTASDGVTWKDVDAQQLAVTLRPAVDSFAVIDANADLWTTNPGFNQDIGIYVAGGSYPSTPMQPEAWKESGGPYTFSPNAANVQTVVRLAPGNIYTIKLQWKASHPGSSTIVMGAGPLEDGTFSPTRLTAYLVPASSPLVFTVTSTVQHSLSNSDGKAWQPMLTVPFAWPSGTYTLFASANADLWTATPGFNQDIGIALTGTNSPYGGTQPDIWKESGGSAAFSPNAAFVHARLIMPTAPGPYNATLVWKANQGGASTIYSGAGPVGGHFSPTTLTMIFVPFLLANFMSYDQFSQVDSDGAYWAPVGRPDQMQPSLAVPGGHTYLVSLNVDPWTLVPGYNQDVALMVVGGIYGSGTIVAWKESGGHTAYSPNAAFVSAVVVAPDPSISYGISMVWKANRIATQSNAILAGAGPVGGVYSETPLNVMQLS